MSEEPPAVELTRREVPRPPQPRKTRWVGAELLDADFAEPTWIVPELLPEGLTLLGGKPKLGKSWLGLQLACAVGSGGQVFGQAVQQRRVLYLALEDSPRRVRSRMRFQQWPKLESVTIDVDADPSELPALIEATRCEFCIVDTLSRFYNLDQNDVQPVTEALGQLQKVSHSAGISIMVIDHHKKKGTGDPIGDLLGSTGKGAVADTIWGLYRNRGQRLANLRVVGRDISDDEIRLMWDEKLCCWQPVTDEATGRHDQAILAALAEGPAGVSEIARRVDLNKGAAHHSLARLLEKRLILQDVASKEYSLLTLSV